MPAKNIIKSYVKNGYYHIYNRGVEKRDIFLDSQDCKVFLHYLKLYLSTPEELKNLASSKTISSSSLRIQRFINLNLSKEIDLLAFVLMPNHFHLQIKQLTTNGIIKLMRRLTTSYVMYFNRKYNRIGPLFQSAYRAVLIETENHLLHLSRYIHLNTLNNHSPINFTQFSSYLYYLSVKKTSWIKPDEILSYFKTAQKSDLKDILSYQNFVEDYKEDSAEILSNLVLEKS
ncbi:MAG: transposase [Candidatus Shapirobacteria bacterium]|nr:transposase [Candidatus Shapirobacteria bacterium]